MNRFVTVLLGLALGLLITDSRSFAQTAEPLVEQVDVYVQQVVKDWNVPGLAVAIVLDDKVVMAKGYGVREIGTTNAVDENTLFAIASNSKAFTATALAILVDEGKLDWDDPVIRYLPEFAMPDPYVTTQMTIRDLLCHRSGMDTFSGDLLWYDTTYTADEIVKRIRHLQPVSSFRSRYGYQNLMYITAGKVIERVSGKTWAAFVQERILKPCGMNRTTTSVQDMTENFASPHNESTGKLRALPPGNVDNSWGACGLNSSVADLSNWMRLQLGRGAFEGNQVISKRQSWELWQPNTIIPISEAAAEKNPTKHFQGYGLGFVLYDYLGKKIVNHSGGLDGMISQLAMVPESRLGLVVLTNSESPASRIVRDRILDLFLSATELRDWNQEALAAKKAADEAKLAADKVIDEAHQSGTTPTLPLEQYVGTYSSELYGEVKIEWEADHLVMKLIPAPNFVADLSHWHFNTFEIKWRDTVHYNFPRGFVNFTIDQKPKPHQLVIDQPNDDFWFYELELFRKD